MTTVRNAASRARAGSRTRCIVTLHGIGAPERSLEPGEEQYWISLDQWRTSLDRLGPRPEVEFTFDDGNRSDLLIGAADLGSRGLSGTFFVVADRIGRKGFLDAGDIRSLLQMGMTVGTHGMRHRPWAGLSRQDLQEEIFDAKDRIEQAMGAPLYEAACPFGAYDRRSLDALRRAGVRRTLTSDGGWASPDSWIQPRTSIRADHTVADLDRLLLPSPPVADVKRRLKGLVKRWL